MRATAPTARLGDGMVLDEGIIVEIVRPAAASRSPPGEIGEVVVTTLTPEYPLIRFATGDLSAMLQGPTTTRRLAGPTTGSEAGSAAPIRRPRCAACSSIPSRSPRSLRRHKSIIRARLVVERPASADQMTLFVETRRAGR